MNNQRQRRQLTTRKPPGQKNTLTSKPQEKTMTAATHTQAVEQQETQDAQMEKTTDVLKEAASPEHPSTRNDDYKNTHAASSAASEGRDEANQPTDHKSPQAGDQSDWQAHFMPVTLNHYHQQLLQPRHQAEPQRRLTLPIPDRLHRDIKVYCAQKDLQMGNLIAALLQTCFYGDQDKALTPLVDAEPKKNASGQQAIHSVQSLQSLKVA